MGSAVPLAIGTRGTVGSLVRREIEFFKRHDLECASSASKRHQEAGNSRVLAYTKSASHSKASTASSSINSPGNFLIMSWRKTKKKKKKTNKNGGSFLPSMCSAVDVSEANRFDGIPGFSYRSLNTDVKLCK